MEANIFISYSSVDASLASEIVRTLENIGETVFIDEKDILLGDKINPKVKQGIQACTFLIVIVSPASLQSAWVSFEIGLAIAFEKKIIPYLTHSSLEIPSFISSSKRIYNISELRDCFFDHYIPENIKKKSFDSSKSVSWNGFVLAIGGANGEYTMHLSEPFQMGTKHQIKSSSKLLGGSGLNVSLRLLHASIPTLPILTVGNDELGKETRKEILEAAINTKKSSKIKTFMSPKNFFVPDLDTPRSNIIVDLYDRGIIKEDAKGTNNFTSHLMDRVENLLEGTSLNISALTIGHIRADSPDINPENPGCCTKYIIEKFRERCHILANLGNSQIVMGYDFWKDEIEAIDILQLHIEEMKVLFASNNKELKLTEIIDILIEKKISAIVTLDEFGAVCTFEDAGDRIIIAPPFELGNIVDPTGAGDAFAAGLIATLAQSPTISFSNLYSAVDDARFWAAKACLSLGGSSTCPQRSELDEFKAQLQKREDNSLEFKKKSEADKYLRIIEKAYSKKSR